MARHEVFQLSERQDAEHEEERAGLLEDAVNSEDGSDVSDVEELGTKRDFGGGPLESTAQRLRRNWKRILVVALLAAWTIGFLIHSFLSSSNASSNKSAVAQLRPEEDYILDSKWNFDPEPVTREYDWTISEHDLNPDGVYRSMILINSIFPGPLIECNEGDEIVVHVHNKASNATSIHWHGMFQNGTNWMDGTVGISQCPIAPGQSFTYRFKVTDQTGTYWYHSHMGMQASDGLVGPIVVHARGGEESRLQKVPYGQDRVVLVSDHYYDLSSKLLMQYLQPGNENEEPVPQSALINGRGTRNCADLPNRSCSSVDRTNAFFDLSTEHNTRIRFINVGAFAEFQIQIDEHEFFLTEVDGTDVHPQSIHRLNINPAQRYSIVVPPPKDNKDLYWMRARMISHCFAYEEPELKEEVRAVIRYQTPSTSATPSSRDWPEIIELECRDLNVSALKPIHAIAAPETADDQVYLRSSFQIRDWRLSRGFLNDSSYRANISHPTLHTLVSAYEKKQEPHMYLLSYPSGINTGFDPKHTLVYQTTGIRTIDILVQNFDDGNHPFHLHGYKFFVLASGHGYPPEGLYDALDVTNPLRRDTASVEAFGWTLVRFVADNAGVWPFHCHLGWHNEAGLLMQFVTRADEVARWTVPDEARGLCDAEGIDRGAGPDDEIWFGSFD
ncbi:multicopper oxidase [Karstenula rhodostoma CBS 690.94]|uniref:Multicopper oxidase n=1 Tax=Karstenula rhodostoma CBS 690.94 TaxID=1392251 RepID=A0A9P4P8B9_9PLEO|nr:multicopper oxidase [Karstenula rhodostoma CBS 690.94]